MTGPRLTIACLADSADTAAKILLLVRSVREFAGTLANARVLVLSPDARAAVPDALLGALAEAGARIEKLALGPDVPDLPFAAKVRAAAAAEAALAEDGATGGAGQLVWMDPDTLVLRAPHALLLRHDESLAYRPVHHRLIGSSFGEPLDEYWSTVYELCGVPDEAVFPMRTCADRHTIRPYVNAGLLAVRPGVGIMRRWRDSFEAHCLAPELRALYEREPQYAVFTHQAILSGVILASVERALIRELPEWYNYPLHLHLQYSAERRPRRLNELTTCRYEVRSLGAESWTALPIDEPLSSWLALRRQEIDEVLGESDPGG